MKKIIAEAARNLAPGPSTLPTGRKLNEEEKGMEIETRSLGPATTDPDKKRHVGTVESYVIKAPPDDPDREKPSVWKDAPAWLTKGGLYPKPPKGDE